MVADPREAAWNVAAATANVVQRVEELVNGMTDRMRSAVDRITLPENVRDAAQRASKINAEGPSDFFHGKRRNAGKRREASFGVVEI